MSSKTERKGGEKKKKTKCTYLVILADRPGGDAACSLLLQSPCMHVVDLVSDCLPLVSSLLVFSGDVLGPCDALYSQVELVFRRDRC